MLSYDVVILALNYALLGHGIYYVPAGSLTWTYPPTLLPSTAQYVLQVMLYPPQKFLDFKGGRPEGPGALGFPNGVIPCTKYAVVEDGVKYQVCAYKNIIVYEKYIGKVAIEVGVRPTLKALELLPFITDPASPMVKTVLSIVAILITIGALVSLIHWKELVIIPM